MKILVAGATGLLGSAFTEFGIESIPKHMHSQTCYLNEYLDILEPDIIIDCTGYNHVDAIENSYPCFEEALKINGNFALANYCLSRDIRYITFSSDYVFDGVKGDYIGDEQPCPLNNYGLTKLVGEQRPGIIIRTSWLFGPHKECFLDKIDQTRKQQRVKIVCDQFGRPTYTNELALNVFKMCFMIDQIPNGIYQLSGSEVTSWYMFAHKTFDPLHIDRFTPIFTAELNTETKRPRRVNLITTPLLRDLGIELTNPLRDNINDWLLRRSLRT